MGYMWEARDTDSWCGFEDCCKLSPSKHFLTFPMPASDPFTPASTSHGGLLALEKNNEALRTFPGNWLTICMCP